MKLIANGLLIFVLTLLSSLNQSDTTLIFNTMSDINKTQLKVQVELPEKIRAGQPCEVQNSLSRELYIIICHLGTTENVGIQKVLYERQFSASDDFVKLLPDEKISVKFNLFDWYEFPKTGNYSLQVCYQVDEKLAYKPNGLVEGIFCSEKKLVTFETD